MPIKDANNITIESTSLPGNDLLLYVFYVDCGDVQTCYTNYDVNYSFLLEYINFLLILMTVDLLILVAKTYYAVQVILKGAY